MGYVFFGEILEIPEGAKYLSVSIDGDGSMGRLEFGDVVCKSLFNRGPFKISG